MASICLFDMDLCYGGGHSPPNLELMKVANYYLKKGHIVNLGSPKENFERYNQIIFFKDRPGTRIPKDLSLSGQNKQIYGYGFYNRFIPLDTKF